VDAVGADDHLDRHAFEHGVFDRQSPPRQREQSDTGRYGVGLKKRREIGTLQRADDNAVNASRKPEKVVVESACFQGDAVVAPD
jgi:hypothetical protein